MQAQVQVGPSTVRKIAAELYSKLANIPLTTAERDILDVRLEKVPPRLSSSAKCNRPLTVEGPYLWLYFNYCDLDVEGTVKLAVELRRRLGMPVLLHIDGRPDHATKIGRSGVDRLIELADKEGVVACYDWDYLIFAP